MNSKIENAVRVHIPKQGGLQLHYFPDGKGASDSELREYAPAVFAENGYAGTTKATYQHVSTIGLVHDLRQEGWIVTACGQKFTRDTKRYEFTRHFLRLRHQDAPVLSSGADKYVPEALVLNGHDGTAAWRFYLGAFRFICMNGLVFGEMVQQVKCHHSMRQAGERGVKAMELTKALLSQMPEKMGMIDTLSNIMLTPAQAQEYAMRALAVRWPQGDSKNRFIPITADQILTSNFKEDEGMSAWKVFNRVQFHLVTQGDVAGHSRTGRQTTTRAVKRVDKMLAVNIGLWDTMLDVAGVKKPTVTVTVPAVVDAVVVSETPVVKAPKAEKKAKVVKTAVVAPAPKAKRTKKEKVAA